MTWEENADTVVQEAPEIARETRLGLEERTKTQMEHGPAAVETAVLRLSRITTGVLKMERIVVAMGLRMESVKLRTTSVRMY